MAGRPAGYRPLTNLTGLRIPCKGIRCTPGLQPIILGIGCRVSGEVRLRFLRILDAN